MIRFLLDLKHRKLLPLIAHAISLTARRDTIHVTDPD